MKNRTIAAFVAFVVVAAILWAGGLSRSKAAAPQAAQPTLSNLMAAYDGESNARVRYQAFAKQADAEGYGAVASLFRAAARAEGIHANNHAEVIRQMGGTPRAEVKPPQVKTTAENLKAAIAGEEYERDVMYPKFLALAKAENNGAAVETLEYAGQAEGTHARLYTEALNNLSQWKAPARKFYVCTVCGYTVSEITFKKCPSCKSPKEKYEAVS
jgi:rubrerythrin